jgi:hypothetical protein
MPNINGMGFAFFATIMPNLDGAQLASALNMPNKLVRFVQLQTCQNALAHFLQLKL